MVMAYSAQYRVTVILGGAAGFESPNGQVRLLNVQGAKPPTNKEDAQMITKEERKKLVERIACDYSRGSLEQIAKNAGYKTPQKIDRGKLEHIAYINYTLGDTWSGRYQIVDAITRDVLVKDCSLKSMIDFIMRRCIYNWFEESEYPILRDSFQHKVYVFHR